MLPSQQYSTWVEVDLGAIQNNVHYIQTSTGVQVLAVVKANGYGHGSIPVAMAALDGGATWLGVARINEAIDLRRGGIIAPILLMGYIAPLQFFDAIDHDISLTVWSAQQVKLAIDIAGRANRPALLHIKVDTGMSRLGISPEEAVDLARFIAGNKHLRLQGIFTHFARADERDEPTTSRQIERFTTALDALREAGIQAEVVHAANSAASLSRPSALFNMVRLGIAMYGLHPSPECPLPPAFRPALAWKSVLSQIKVVPPGVGISYGHLYVTRSYERIGTIPVGYADGFRRTTGNQVLVQGKLVPVVGRVCMDQIMVSLDAVPEARTGDEVVLIGEQMGAKYTAEDVAQAWGTINYEVTCGIGPRVPRLYTSP
jgi:alanine racemase